MTLHNGPFRPPLAAATASETAARETSMDDILASIRRIIADDDALPLSNSARAAQRAAAPAPAAATTRPPAPSNARAPAPKPAASRPAAPRPAPPPPAKPAPSAPTPDRRLASPQAASPIEPPLSPPVGTRLASPAPPASHVAPHASSLAPTPGEAEQTARTPETAARPPRGPSLKLSDFASPSTAAPPVPRAEEEGVAPVLRLPPIAEAPRPPVSAPIANLAEARLKASARVDAQDHFRDNAQRPVRDDGWRATVATQRLNAEPAAPELTGSALLSAQAGEKISASFANLAENIALRDPELIQRLTREILRPMLKDWLDAHLPELVEKLVRAEIERMTRGCPAPNL